MIPTIDQDIIPTLVEGDPPPSYLFLFTFEHHLLATQWHVSWEDPTKRQQKKKKKDVFQRHESGRKGRVRNQNGDCRTSHTPTHEFAPAPNKTQWFENDGIRVLYSPVSMITGERRIPGIWNVRIVHSDG